MSAWSEPGLAAQSYASLIHFRVRDGMPINDWVVDWSREPLTHTYYDTQDVFPVSLPTNEDLFGKASSSPEFIAHLIYASYGFTGLRLTINCNDRPQVYELASAVKIGRHTASGGGRYCTDFYLVESGRGETRLPAGVFHYSPLRHTWERISFGDSTARVATAQGYGTVAERYVLMTIDYWRSGFKYNDFTYQATSMDIGTAIGTIAEVTGQRTAGTWDMWVNETELASILGLDPLRTGIYVVQAWGSQREYPDDLSVPCPDVAARAADQSDVIDFVTTKALQTDMVIFPSRPAGLAIRPVAMDLSADHLDLARWEDLHRRQTSFGRFTGQAYPLEVLVDLLTAGNKVISQFATERGQPLARWSYLVYVSNVSGLVPGLYRHVPETQELELMSAERQDEFLAGTYFLKNYDGCKASATIIACGNVFECAREWGVRGYRWINAIIGSVCQAISVEAVRHGIGTGTALGFDADAHAVHADLDVDRISPMLMIMTGVDNPYAGEFRTDASVIGAQV